MSFVSFEMLSFLGSPSLGAGGSSDGIWRCTFAGWAALYKNFDLGDEVVDADALENLIGWRERLDNQDRAFLDARTAWPRYGVFGDDGAAVGVLMPEAPRQFWRTNGRILAPRPAVALSEERDRALRRHVEYFEPPRKIAVLGHFLETMAFLHARDVVIGDVQPNNLLVSGPNDTPSSFLIDCDSVIVGGLAARRVVEPRFMAPPKSGQGTHDRKSDLYKFALVVAKCLYEDNSQKELPLDILSRVVPSEEIALLEGFLRSQPLVEDHPVHLRRIARSWKSQVGSKGDLFARTDQFLRQPWGTQGDFSRGPTLPEHAAPIEETTWAAYERSYQGAPGPGLSLTEDDPKLASEDSVSTGAGWSVPPPRSSPQPSSSARRTDFYARVAAVLLVAAFVLVHLKDAGLL